MSTEWNEYLKKSKSTLDNSKILKNSFNQYRETANYKEALENYKLKIAAIIWPDAVYEFVDKMSDESVRYAFSDEELNWVSKNLVAENTNLKNNPYFNGEEDINRKRKAINNSDYYWDEKAA